MTTPICHDYDHDHGHDYAHVNALSFFLETDFFHCRCIVCIHFHHRAYDHVILFYHHHAYGHDHDRVIFLLNLFHGRAYVHGHDDHARDRDHAHILHQFLHPYDNGHPLNATMTFILD